MFATMFDNAPASPETAKAAWTRLVQTASSSWRLPSRPRRPAGRQGAGTAASARGATAPEGGYSHSMVLGGLEETS